MGYIFPTICPSWGIYVLLAEDQQERDQPLPNQGAEPQRLIRNQAGNEVARRFK